MDVVSFRDWAGLPAHILDLMVIKLDTLFDYVRFCGVCPQWRDVAFEARVKHKVDLDVLKASRRKLPMLMFKTEEHNDECRSMYDVSGGKTFTVKLPLPNRYRFVGSSRGWLFYLAETMVVTLVNPYNDACISLPPIRNPRQLYVEWRRMFFQFYIDKGILLSDPSLSPNNFVLVVIYDGKLAVFLSNEASWNFLNEDDDLFIRDIIYYKGTVYAVCYDGHVFEVDIEGRSIKTISPANDRRANMLYLVESQDGELLMVKRAWIPRDVPRVRYQEREPAADNGEPAADNGEPAADNGETRADNGEPAEDIGEPADDIGEPAADIGEFLDNEDNEGYNDDDLALSDAESVGSQESYDTRYPHTDYDVDSFLPRTCEFKVLKMTNPVDQGSATWVEIDNIGEQALFLGENESMSVSTAEFPGCLPNSIYYTPQHHRIEWPYTYKGPEEDCGIFSLEDGKFYKHHVLGSSHKYVQPPIWFLPNPQEIN